MKKFLAVFAVLAFAFAAKADGSSDELGSVLLWMVDSKQGGSDPVLFQYAMILAYDGSSSEGIRLMMDSPDGPQPAVVNSKFPDLGTSTDEAYASLLDLQGCSPSTLRFAVELYNSEGSKVGISDYVDYASLLDGGHIYKDTWTTGITPYVFSAEAVPEPTGGVLVLLGFGLLGLRRKRV